MICEKRMLLDRATLTAAEFFPEDGNEGRRVVDGPRLGLRGRPAAAMRFRAAVGGCFAPTVRVRSIGSDGEPRSERQGLAGAHRMERAEAEFFAYAGHSTVAPADRMPFRPVDLGLAPVS